MVKNRRRKLYLFWSIALCFTNISSGMTQQAPGTDVPEVEESLKNPELTLFQPFRKEGTVIVDASKQDRPPDWTPSGMAPTTPWIPKRFHPPLSTRVTRSYSTKQEKKLENPAGLNLIVDIQERLVGYVTGFLSHFTSTSRTFEKPMDNGRDFVSWISRIMGLTGKSLGEFLREYQVHVLYDLIFTFFKWIFFLYIGLIIP